MAVVAVAAPLLLGYFPRLRLPSVVVEIVAGIVLGPSVLGLAEIDLPVQVLAVLSLAFLLFLAGLEIDLRRQRGPALRMAGLGYHSGPDVDLAAGRLCRPRHAVRVGTGLPHCAAVRTRCAGVAVLPIARPIRHACGCPAAGDFTAVPRHCSDHGIQTDFISPTTGAALVCAGLLSVMIFPALAGPQLPQRAEAAGVRDYVAMHFEAM